MSLRKLREALARTVLPADAEEAIASAEEKQRDDASFMEYMASEIKRLKFKLGEEENSSEGNASALRKEWEQSKSKSQGSHVLGFPRFLGH